MRCSYQPIASASSVSEAIIRANVRTSALSSPAGSWYCSKPISSPSRVVCTAPKTQSWLGRQPRLVETLPPRDLLEQHPVGEPLDGCSIVGEDPPAWACANELTPKERQKRAQATRYA